MSTISSQDTTRISNQTGLNSATVSALALYSKQYRNQFKLLLIGYRNELQSQELTYAYKGYLATRRASEEVKKQEQVDKALTALGSTMEFLDDPRLQDLVKLLLQASSSKKLTSSYRDIENSRYRAKYKVKQAQYAGDIINEQASQIQARINNINKYIAVIDLIDRV